MVLEAATERLAIQRGAVERSPDPAVALQTGAEAMPLSP
jgi:hypothetical protein